MNCATILLDLVAAGVVAGRHTFNALLEAHAAAGDVLAARDMYETMIDRGVKADHCTFIALFMVRTLSPPCHCSHDTWRALLMNEGGS